MRVRLPSTALLSAVALISTLLWSQDTTLPKPAVIGSTYVLNLRVGGKTVKRTVHLWETDGRLTLATKWTDGRQHSDAVEYEKVNHVATFAVVGEPSADIKYLVDIKDSDGKSLSVGVRAKGEADELAEYVARKSPLHLEQIAGVWRVRKRFHCPEHAGLGCRDFKELLDNDDPDIVEYFYASGDDFSTYACFEDSGNRFFVAQFGGAGDIGTLVYEEFQNEQSRRREIREIRWLRNGTTGYITESRLGVQPGRKPQTLGMTDDSSFSYHTKFGNKEGTTTDYSLDIRWETLRYTESWSWKAGEKIQSPDSAGICVNLN